MATVAQVIGSPTGEAAPVQYEMDSAPTPSVPMEQILASLKQHWWFDIIEKPDMYEMGANFILETFFRNLDVDLPNKYKILGQNGKELFFAMETTSVLESSLGWFFGMDVAYTDGGSAAPMWKMRGDTAETTVANAATNEVEGFVWALEESWCCPIKSLSRFCHGSHVEGKCCCLCCCDICGEAYLELCCCCFNQSHYLIDSYISPATQQVRNTVAPMNAQRSSSSSLIRKSSTNVNLEKTEASLVIVDRRCCTCPWFLTGLMGEGSNWSILKDAKRDESQNPLVAWTGKEIGTLRREGKGLCATWILPAHGKDHWKLNLSGTNDSKDKLAAIATVLFMDHSNQDQANDA